MRAYGELPVFFTHSPTIGGRDRVVEKKFWTIQARNGSSTQDSINRLFFARVRVCLRVCMCVVGV